MNEEIREDIAAALTRLLSWFEKTSLYDQFTAYPHQQQITYTTHAWRNAKESVKLGMKALRLWIHAFFPFLFQSESFGKEKETPPVKEVQENPDQRLKTE